MEKILVDTGNHCATLRPTIAPLAAEAVEGWQSRNGLYLLRSAHYRKDLQNAIEARPDSGQARGLQRLVGPEVDAIVQSLADRTVGGFKKDLEDNPTASEELCRGYLEGAKDGKLDLKIRDPEVAQFLDKVSVEPRTPTEQR
ncbi:hypothetical protein CupriaWKF_12555 [Cupriavidus sp. WKF15]|uniref:hypothetical protein n=1 Tax=Cupriavidus sp. WKF15 TaxID=3032282 RepID=UPI0023E1A564|nr:hypothetical protein [Cupriavidus sp. WKF15]WER45138.1 hypothetical protein CupriaWKF_12555 [Cupriavidus sp. WKF15]